MEYYSGLKREEILTHATTWMNLEDVILSEIRKSRKDKYWPNVVAHAYNPATQKAETEG